MCTFFAGSDFSEETTYGIVKTEFTFLKMYCNSA